MPMWAKIYKLYSNENDEFYIGSTKKLAHIRLREHIKDAERSQSKKAKWIIQNKCVVNISIIDYVEYETIKTLYERETYWIHKLNPTLNTIRNPLGVSRNSKTICEVCSKVMNKSSLYRHKKVCLFLAREDEGQTIA